ncbi:MAG: type sorting protein [Sediminibacterium sp.]|nr:type sorting protein [Sediminibacterium sp.]
MLSALFFAPHASVYFASIMKLTFRRKPRRCNCCIDQPIVINIKSVFCKKIFLLAVLLVTGVLCDAQSIYPSTINVTGQFGTLKDFQFEISIGESTSITTMSNSLLVVTSGVLQTSVAYQPPINFATSFSDEINLYPNPARDFVQVNFVGKLMGKNQYELYDMQGKKIMSKQFYYFGIPRTERLDINRLLPGTYILSIQQYSPVTNEVIKKGSFKIVKVN